MTLPRIGAFFDFMKERELIRLRKEAGQPFPWTQDEILRDYKFTNVRRYHDRTSNALREMFYMEHFFDDRRSILMNAALFRYFGTAEFAEAVGWQDYDDFDFEGIIECANNRFDRKLRVFTGAYVITNQGISAPKQEVVVNHFLRELHKATPDLLQCVQKTRSWKSVVEKMSTINGFGGTGFMAKEILLDTMYTSFWSDIALVSEPTKEDFSYPEDYMTWTPIGPGARRGAARVNGIENVDGPEASSFLGNNSTKPTDTIKVLVQLQERYWPVLDRGVLAPTDIQFQLCEFDKYERVRLGQGRPRSKYRPTEA